MKPIDRDQVRLLEQRLRGIGVDRRTFLKVAAAGLAAPAAGSLLAACGGSDDSDTDATSTTAAPAATTGISGNAAASPTPAKLADVTATTEPEEASPTTGGDSSEMDTDQTFHVIGQRQEPASHDFNADLYSGGAAQIWMGLSTYDVDFTPMPGWAESWEPNEDASVWTYKLRKDNKGFSNGDPVTADTFVYSWRRMLLPETKAPYASILTFADKALRKEGQ